jgi:hypothetical protein
LLSAAQLIRLGLQIEQDARDMSQILAQSVKQAVAKSEVEVRH